MSKTIVFCADGTWNSPGQVGAQPAGPAAGAPAAGSSASGAAAAAPEPGCEPQLTNVCKLFGWLKGELSAPWGSQEMEKSLKGDDGDVVQLGKYIHGVGASQQLLDKVNGGAFGVGVVARIARGYTYISRNYVPGDRIVIVGFSRGAYTARSLAGLIVGEGLLQPELATDAGSKYDNAVAAWFRFRHSHETTLQKVVEFATSFQWIHEAFGNSAKLSDDSFVPLDKLAAVAVWDTVGALGIPAYSLEGSRVDLFEFCNTKLSDKVGLGLHAVALDERRDVFQPTLWDTATNVTQAVFPGGHCDVGGGYPEHGLSDIPLLWFVDRLQQPDVGLRFALQPPTAVAPDALGIAHREWIKPLWQPLGVHPRRLPDDMVLNDSVRRRMNGGPEKVFGLQEAQPAYAPVNLPK